MIAGPILPRTVDGLWDVVRSEPARLERGLRIVRRELVLDGGLVVDALGADAVGCPVLMFAAVLERDRQLPARIADAREWFARNAPMLATVLEGSGLRADLPPRVFVVGFDFTDTCLDRLRRDAAPGLCVFRLEGFYVDGVRHVGVARLHGGEPAGEDEVFGALAEGAVGPLVRRIAELMQRLDPDLVVDGDRYSRTWRLDGATVLRLERDARELRAVVPDGDHPDVVSLQSAHDVAEAVDLGMRRYLAVLAGVGAPEAEPTRDRGAEPGAGAPASRAVDPRAVRARGGLDTEVTADEYEAFFAEEPRS